MRCILALDCGGTKCEALALDESGAVLGWGRCEGGGPGTSNERLGGFGRSEEAILEACAQALNGIVFDDLEIFGSLNRPVALAGRTLPVTFIREADAAFALMGQESGVVVVAGTGAHVFGRTRDGREFGLDGLGPILGDYGSGYQIGLMALRAAAKSEWHPRHSTSLGSLVRKKLLGEAPSNDNGSNLIAFCSLEANRASIAQLAEQAASEAANGDGIAQKIMADASTHLADSVYDVVSHLKLESEEFPLVGTGSLITRSPLYWQLVCSKVQIFAPSFHPIVSDLHPVVGYGVAALTARFPSQYSAPVDSLLRSIRAHSDRTTQLSTR